MIYWQTEFDTEQEAIEYREKVYEDYHPMGYGTHIRIEYDLTTNKWVAKGTRSHTCD
jgi:hypothetical protein